jgi:phosphatidylinositol-3-phosphatase
MASGRLGPLGVLRMTFGRVAALGSIAVALLFVTAGSTEWLEGSAALGGPPAGATTGPRAPHGSLGGTTHPIRHVVVIVLENHELAQIWGSPAQTSYLRYLAATYGNATDYYAVCHPSAPNYLALTGGLPRQCGSDAYHVYNGTNLGDLLEAKGFRWRGYMESMPLACSVHNAGQYVVRHDPFVYYRDVVTNATRCDSHVVNSQQFNRSVVNGTLPTVSVYVPNLQDDCHSAPLAHCDRWLRGFLSPILNATRPSERQTVNHTLFLVTFDEGRSSSHMGFNGTRGGHVLLVAVSPYSRGLTVSGNATHYDLLTTIEWLFHLGRTGGHDGPGFPALRALFSFRSNGY